MAETAEAPRTLIWEHFRGNNDAGVLVNRIAGHADVTAHEHLFHELVFIEAGAVEHRAADGARRLRPGDIIVLRPQVWHAYERARSLTLVNCLIDTALMHRVAPLLQRFENAVELFHRRPRRAGDATPVVLHASPGERSALRTRLNDIVTEQRARRSGWQAAVAAAALDVLVAVLRLHAGAAVSSPDQPRAGLSSRLDQAVLDTATYLETHLSEPVSLAPLAKRVHLSPGHLSRGFSRRMGVGVVDYLHRVRAEEACRLLRCTDESIGRIGARVGYSEVAYFSRCFRAQIGQSPREYRLGGERVTLEVPR